GLGAAISGGRRGRGGGEATCARGPRNGLDPQRPAEPTREGLMSKSSRWPSRTKHAAFRMVEGGLDRTLQAEVRDVVEEQRWAHFITRRNAENDATHRALRARQRSKSPWRVFALRRWTVDVQGIAIAGNTGRWKSWVEL